MIVTIDGPAGAGKSTVARRVAHALNLPLLNSGSIYRALTFLVLETEASFDDREAVSRLVDGMDLRFDDSSRVDEAGEIHFDSRVFLGDREVTSEIRTPEITAEVYRIAGVGEYRDLLVSIQRKAAEPDGVVTEGRDMGTVIFPHAACKVYLDASAEERARRRHREITKAAELTQAAENNESGEIPDFDAVLRAIMDRDEKDRGREQAPLACPEGARVVCSDNMSIEEVVMEIVDHAKAVLASES